MSDLGLSRTARRVRRGLVVVLLASVAFPAQADEITAFSQDPTSGQGEEIVVIGHSLFSDVRPERSLDPDAIESYGLSTIDELLGELQGELGDPDDQPLILVNGERINSQDEIGALPVEALRNAQVLPRGTAVRLGGTSGQRVINLNLRKEVRSATVTASQKIATDGDWHGTGGEGILTRVQGPTRFNVALRTRQEDALFESDRGIVGTQPRLPYAIGGNIIGYPNNVGEIDPLLSAAAGHTVLVAPVLANPTLSSLAAGQPLATDLGQFRTLRPDSENYDLNGSFATRLAPWLTSTASLRLSRGSSLYQRGLASAVFILPAANPASPFSRDVGIAAYGRDPLFNRSRRASNEANLTLNGTFGSWTGNFNARHVRSRDRSRSDRQGGFGAIRLDDGTDPFVTDLTPLIPIGQSFAASRRITTLTQLSLTGPAAKLPAGPLQATIEGRLAWNRTRSESTFSILGGERRFSRSEQWFRGAVDVPITSRANDVLAAVGDISATAEYSRVHFSDVGTLNQHAFGLTWEPLPLLRLRGSIERTDAPPSIETLGNPVIVVPDVRTFDPLTGTTVDVTQISGGNPSLLAQQTRIRRLTALVRLVPKLNLQLNGEYTDTDQRNFISSLPEASAAITLAFPDRFIRDSSGVLTTVDLRPVNFKSDREKRLRWGFSMNTRIGGGSRRPASGVGAARKRAVTTPTTYLQLNANHTIVFSDDIVIRAGLDPVDLLSGGAIGIGGGRLRHQLDGTAGITSGGIGARIGATWRGASTLQSRIGGVTDTLEFSPVFLLNLRAFADARRFLPSAKWAKGLRLSVDVLNVTNDRQRVRDSAGATPLQYQPAYRDPLGRTIEFEIRKVF